MKTELRTNITAQGVFSPILQKASLLLSLLCAIHCSATALLILLLPFLSVSLFQNELLEIALLAISVPVGLFSVLQGYKNHKKVLIPFLFLAGCTSFVSEFIIPMAGNTTHLAGSALISISIIWNFYSSKTCNHKH